MLAVIGHCTPVQKNWQIRPYVGCKISFSKTAANTYCSISQMQHRDSQYNSHFRGEYLVRLVSLTVKQSIRRPRKETNHASQHRSLCSSNTCSPPMESKNSSWTEDCYWPPPLLWSLCYYRRSPPLYPYASKRQQHLKRGHLGRTRDVCLCNRCERTGNTTTFQQSHLGNRLRY
jgi:hypothetical protein